jgi:hypothetical protein
LAIDCLVDNGVVEPIGAALLYALLYPHNTLEKDSDEVQLFSIAVAFLASD